MSDPFDLQRFVSAQEPIYPKVLAELRAGRKRSHWIWFIFPQLAGLGMSSMSMRFAIRSLGEARAYLAHPVLGPRLVECTDLVTARDARALRDILGSPDDMKFRSSMTLFEGLAEDPAPFAAALAKHARGERDRRTLQILGQLRN